MTRSKVSPGQPVRLKVTEVRCQFETALFSGYSTRVGTSTGICPPDDSKGLRPEHFPVVLARELIRLTTVNFGVTPPSPFFPVFARGRDQRAIRRG